MEVVFNILIFYSIIVAILLLGVLLILYTTSDDYYSDILARRDFQKKCPKCQGIWYDRIYRKSWMRLIPGTKLYYCNSCRYKFMIILRRSALRMAYRKSSPLSHPRQGYSISQKVPKLIRAKQLRTHNIPHQNFRSFILEYFIVNVISGMVPFEVSFRVALMGIPHPNSFFIEARSFPCL